MTIPFGPWHPDKAALNAPVCLSAVNCIPAINGFRPLLRPEPSSGAVGLDYITDEIGDYIEDEDGLLITVNTEAVTGTEVIGAAVVFDDESAVSVFAGTQTGLYKLDSSLNWQPVTRGSGGPDYLTDEAGAVVTDELGVVITVPPAEGAYATGGGERWQFGFSGGLVIAVTITEEPQKYLLGSSDVFEPLGGIPPNARYVTTVGEFVVLAGLAADERTVIWSGLANPEHWTPGIHSSDYQTFQNGGPIRGLVGGEVGYVFQAEAVTRMTYVPGSDLIFQFDQVEGGRGLAAPYSLVKLGNEAFYFAADGLYKFSLGGGAATPLGVGKWARWFIADLKASTEQTIIGSADPVGRFLVFAYNSNDNPNTDLNRLLIYDWALDEATTADIPVSTLAQLLTTGVPLDLLDPFGNMETLPYSLDSPVWRGGASLLGLFQDDARLAFLSGETMSATVVTSDGGSMGRSVIKGIRPHIDTRSITAAVAAREAEGDAVSFGAAEDMADTGVIPAWASGFVARARYVTTAGASWQKFAGADVIEGSVGKR